MSGRKIGSVAALRLTEKGYRVAVVEAGRRFADDEFAETSWDQRRYLWAPALGCYGIQRIHALRSVMVLAGSGVGGGSLVYANTLYRPLKPFYADRQWAHITDWKAELAPFYDQAKRMLGVVENPTFTASDEIRTLFRRGKKSRTRHLDAFVFASPAPVARLGVVVPKHRRTIVLRNRLKRREIDGQRVPGRNATRCHASGNGRRRRHHHRPALGPGVVDRCREPRRARAHLAEGAPGR